MSSSVTPCVVEAANGLDAAPPSHRDRGDDLPGVLVDVERARGDPARTARAASRWPGADGDRQPLPAHLRLELVGRARAR